MENIFFDTRYADKIAREKFSLTEDIMVENAARALEEEAAFCTDKNFITSKNFITKPSVLVLVGAGNNGADGYALSRRLVAQNISITTCVVQKAKSEQCIIQKERAKKAGVQFLDFYSLDDFLEEKSFDLVLIYDCIFGSGFHDALPPEAEAVIKSVNGIKGVKKVSCDIPSGLDINGNSRNAYNTDGIVFCADITVTMGALKLCLFNDNAKDFCGNILVANLGISQNNFELCAQEYNYKNNSFLIDTKLLEEKDMRLPFRNNKKNVHKGTFGHVTICTGKKIGASVIAGSASLKFGAGLVTLLGEELETKNIPFDLMCAKDFPQNTNAVAIGMGLSQPETNTKSAQGFVKDALNFIESNPQIPCVLDADIFYYNEINSILENRAFGLVLTPHPKEFSALLKITGFGDFSTTEVQEKRAELCAQFVNKYPGVVLLLKGANTYICTKNAHEKNAQLYVNNIGLPSLSKGGSGDVLSGMISALLAQGYEPLESAINASLAHSLASHKIKNDYALTPFKLIDLVSEL